MEKEIMFHCMEKKSFKNISFSESCSLSYFALTCFFFFFLTNFSFESKIISPERW